MFKGKNYNRLITAIESGVNCVYNEKERIDALNVFPVPDGDTGSNISATLSFALDEVKKMPKTDMAHQGKILKVFSRGMLFGARGNSGVIFSQIIKGFMIECASKKQITIFDIVKGFMGAKKLAYQAVMKPVEGTILTVIKMVSEELNKKVTYTTSQEQIMKMIVDSAKKAVLNTPNLLPVLKEVGVVDSGGEGLYQFFLGCQAALLGSPIKKHIKVSNAPEKYAFLNAHEVFNGDFGYCTEFILQLNQKNKFSKNRFDNVINRHGDSIVSVQDEELLKIHIHTKKPGELLAYAQKHGEFFKIKCENMTEQANQNKASQEPTQLVKNANNHYDLNTKKSAESIAIISVASGRGIIEDMKKCGVDYIIEGGQTFNPSASDIVKAIKAVPTKKIIILPNNSNVILSCQQAAKIITNKKIKIIPTKNQMEGIAALFSFDDEDSLTKNQKNMIEAIKEISTGVVTDCIRTTKIKKVSVKKGQKLAIINGTIVASYVTITKAAKRIVKDLITDDVELVTIYYGEGATKIDAESVQTFIELNYDVDIEIKNGEQGVYHFLISVE